MSAPELVQATPAEQAAHAAAKVATLGTRGGRTDAPERRPPLDWRTLSTQEPPTRRWAIAGWLGFGHTTLLVGPGGIGKTLLAQQIASALALDRQFVDDVRGPLRSLMWACEDDADELWRRQVAIAGWLDEGLDCFAERLHVVPRHGLENALVATDFGRLVFTSRLTELHEQAEDLRAEVVILDNVAQLYGANENDRHQVTAFLNALAGALPGRAILLLAHPGRAAGSEFSGSSAWENTARTRLYLGDRLPDEKAEADEAPAQNVRFLARRKANYSPKDYRRLTFRDGVFVPDELEAPGGMVSYLREQANERIVLDGLSRLQGLGIRATEGQSSPQFLPRVLLEHQLGEGRTKAELAAAMRRLRIAGKITAGPVGRYPNRSPMTGLLVAEAHK